jgi:hypothetical protein
MEETIQYWKNVRFEMSKENVTPSFLEWGLVVFGMSLLAVVAFSPFPEISWIYRIPGFPFLFQYQIFWQNVKKKTNLRVKNFFLTGVLGGSSDPHYRGPLFSLTCLYKGHSVNEEGIGTIWMVSPNRFIGLPILRTLSQWL